MKRVLLKISGEALSSENISIHPEKIQQISHIISEAQKLGTQIVIVFGGGNIYRGSSLIAAGVNSSDSHNMSMLSTVFNAVATKNFLEKIGISCVVMDALGVEFLERYTSQKAKKYIELGEIVICSSGTGAPFFTTDTGGVLRALELECDAMIKLTKVDGVYESDPLKNPTAQRYDALSYDDIIKKDLKILDASAVIMARDNVLPIFVSKLDDAQSLQNILEGRSAGTKIS